VFDYRGEVVPVVDVSAMLLGRASERRMSTRLVLVHYPDQGGVSRTLGLLLEKTLRTMRRERSDFKENGVAHPETPCLGPVASDEGRLIQWVDPHRLLSDGVRDVLFPEPAAA